MSVKTPEQYEADYLDGVKEAFRRGLIVSHGSGEFTLGPEDAYSHICSKSGRIRNANSASLLPPAENILRAICKRTSSPRVLAMGSGVGFEVSQISRILQDASVNPVVETVSLTPINPFLRCTIGKESGHGALPIRVRSSVETALGQQEPTLTREDIRRRVDEIIGEYNFWGAISMETVLAAQDRLGMEIFERLERPYIDRQHIGKFPSDVRLDGQYDFIYDNRGVMRYSDSIGRKKALQLRSPEGVFYYSPLVSEEYEERYAAGKGNPLFTGEDLVLADMDWKEAEWGCVVTNRTSEIGRRLMSVIGDRGRLNPKTNITRVEYAAECLSKALV